MFSQAETTNGTLKAEVGMNSFTATATKMKQLCIWI
jgi:hypothetical protein